MSDVLQRWLQFLQGDGCAFVVTLALAATIAALAVLPVRWFALKISAIDVPGGRHLHLRPTARLGGVAVMVAIVIALPLGLWALVESRPEVTDQTRAIWPILITTISVCAIGAWDDVRPLSASRKLFALCCAGSVLVASGVQMDIVDLPLLGRIELGRWAAIATVVWVVACANAVNLIDGVDGLGAGVTMVSALALALVAFGVGDSATALGFAAVAGACAGFLVHNREPARIFLGDSGALSLGFLLAALSASGCTKRANALFLFAALCALSVPLLDSAQAFTRRFRRTWCADPGHSVWRALRATGVGDREHIHHRLLGRGFSPRQVARILSLGTMVPCLLTLLLLPSGEIGWTTVCGSALAAAYVLLRLAALPPRPKPRGPKPRGLEPEFVLPALSPKPGAREISTETAGAADVAKEHA